MLYTAGAFHVLPPFHWEHVGGELGPRVAVLETTYTERRHSVLSTTKLPQSDPF